MRPSSWAATSPWARCPSETLERLRALGDRRALDSRQRRPRAHARRGGTGAAGRARLGAGAALDEQIAFLHGLPERLELDVDGLGRVLFCHASPRNDVDVFLEGTPEERVAPLFAGIEAGTVVCGHTHMQFARDIAGMRVVNAGSVGIAVRGRAGRLLGSARAWSRAPAHGLRRVERSRASRSRAGTSRGDRPSKAEVTEFFGTLAVGA